MSGPRAGLEEEAGGASYLVEPSPAVEASPALAKSHDGHRDRLRARFLEAGPGALADYEMLELVLFRAIPRRDVKPLAKALLQRFGTLADAVNASPARLIEVDGMTKAAATDLQVLAALHQRVMRSQIRQREVLSSWQAVIDYCHAAMAYETREQFRILFLDKRNALIADEVQGTGTVDHTPAYPREVVRRALELSATAVILVHNHPSGDPTPSRADIELTRQIVAAAQTLGIGVHDHIIIGRNSQASFRGLGLIG